MASSGTSGGGGSPGSPCGACKFLRRKCAAECVFAPHFCAEDGAAQFAAIHKVFGASNAAKLLQQVAPADRSEAAATVTYEAQARLRDPVYGCVAHIFALQQQVHACMPCLILRVHEITTSTRLLASLCLSGRVTPMMYYICAGGELADAGAAGEGAGGADDGGGRRAAGDDGQQPSPAAVAAGARIAVDAELRVLQRHVLRLR